MDREKLWEDVDWTSVEIKVAEKQRLVYKASKTNDQVTVVAHQRELVNSFEAKLLAVRLTTSLNRGRFTPGVDRKIITTAEEKYKLAENLRLNGKAQPIRRVMIPKPGKVEKRPLGIPTITDRAKQALAKLALEPQWEAVFEPNSYGFRPGRSVNDAIKQTHNRLRSVKTHTVISSYWVLEGDIRKCFDEIDHDKLLGKIDQLGTFPQMRNQIEAWLKAGILEGFSNDSPNSEVLENSKGTPQGGIISPLLANIALHGLENHLKDAAEAIPLPKDKGSTSMRRSALGVIRYADDFVVISKYRDVIMQMLPEVNNFLATIGLALSEEKTKITNSCEGFDFLGFTCITPKCADGTYTTRIYPSDKAQTKHIATMRDVYQKGKSWSASKLIRTLNPKIIGWCNAFKQWDTYDVFSKVDNQQWGMTRHWVYRKSNKISRTELTKRFFTGAEIETQITTKGKKQEPRHDKWVLTDTYLDKKGKTKRVFLYKHSWIKKEINPFSGKPARWVKVVGDKSPYDGDELYWGERLEKYAGLPREKARLLKDQEGRCAFCHQKFNFGDITNVDHIVELQDGGPDKYSNKQLLHLHCHDRKTKRLSWQRRQARLHQSLMADSEAELNVVNVSMNTKNQ
jgi:RNA-directed DNA polymerase